MTIGIGAGGALATAALKAKTIDGHSEIDEAHPAMPTAKHNCWALIAMPAA